MTTMNDWIRAAVRGQPQQEQPQLEIPDHTVKSYADVWGTTLADARARLVEAWTPKPPTPPGNAGSGTQQPPARKRDMNQILRQAVWSKRL